MVDGVDGERRDTFSDLTVPRDALTARRIERFTSGTHVSVHVRNACPDHPPHGVGLIAETCAVFVIVG